MSDKCNSFFEKKIDSNLYKNHQLHAFSFAILEVTGLECLILKLLLMNALSKDIRHKAWRTQLYQ